MVDNSDITVSVGIDSANAKKGAEEVKKSFDDIKRKHEQVQTEVGKTSTAHQALNRTLSDYDKSLKSASAAQKQQSSSLSMYNEQLKRAVSLAQIESSTVLKSTQEKIMAKAVVNALAAAQKDYANGLRASAALTNEEIALVKKRAAVLGEAKNQLQSMHEPLIKVTALWKGLFVVGIATAITKQMADFSDSITTLNNKLKIVTTSEENLVAVKNRLYDISNKVGVSVEGVATLFSRTSFAADNLGISQEQAAQFTENLAKALKVGGATATEATSVMEQFSQALAKGTINGDEFRSLLENSQITLKAFSAATGKTQGQLIEMASKGLLSAKIGFEAIAGATAMLDIELAKLAPTFDKAFIIISNSIKILFDDITSAVSSSNTFANALISVGETIREVAPYVAALASGVKTVLGSAFLTTAYILESFAVTAGAVAVAVYEGFRNAFVKIAEIFRGFENGISNFVNNPFGSGNFSELSKSLEVGVIDSFSNAFNVVLDDAKVIQGKLKDQLKTDILELAAETRAATDKIIFPGSGKLNTDKGNYVPPPDRNKDKKRALDSYNDSLEKNIELEKASIAVLKNSAVVSAKVLDQEKAMAKQQAVSKALVEAENKARVDFEKHLRASPKLRDSEATSIRKQAEELADLNEELKEEQRLNNLVKSAVEETRTPAEQTAKAMEDLARAGETALGRTAEGAEGLRRKMEQVRDQLNPMAQVFKDIATSINESFTSMFEDLFSGTKNTFSKITDTIKSMFVKLLAQMATLAIAKPIIIPLITGIGGAFGLSGSAIGAVTKELGYTSGGSALGTGDALSLGSSLTSLLTGGGGNLGMTFAKAAGALGLGNSGISSAFDIGTSFNAGSGLAGAGGNILANLIFGGDRGIGATLGGTGGSIAGAIIGNMLLPGAGSVIGSLLGSFGGNFLGGLFGGKKPSSKLQAGTVDLATGEIIARQGLDGKKFSQENYDAVTTLSQITSGLAKAFGVSGEVSVAASDRYGYGYTINDPISEFFSGSGSSIKNFKTPNEFIEGMLKDFRESFPEKFSESVNTALKNIDWGKDQKGLESALSDLNFALNFDKLGETTEQVNSAKQALDEIKDQFDQLRATAKRLGLEVEKVNMAEQKALDLLRSQYLEARAGDLVGLVSPAAGAIGDEIKNRANLIEQANTLGVSTTLITMASDIRLQKLREQLVQEQALTTEQNNQLEVEKERLSTASQLSSKYKSISENLGKAITNLRLGNSSLLSPKQKLDEARALYQSTLSSALGGNTDAAEELSSIGDKVVELTRAYNATSVAAAEDIRMVEEGYKSVKDVADRQYDVQQQILTAAQNQIDAINNAAKTISEAVLGTQQVSTANGTFSASNPNEVAIRSLMDDPSRAGKRYLTTASGAKLTDDDLIGIYRSVGYTGTPGGGSVSRFFESNPAAADAFRSVAKSLGIPGFARGGRTPANSPFMVGENRPEIMSFNQSGRVYAINDNGELITLLTNLSKEQRATVNILSNGLSKLIDLQEKSVEMGEEELSAKRRAGS